MTLNWKNLEKPAKDQCPPALQRSGEMDDKQLWETTLDPDSRILAQISISDTVEADEVTDILMGSNVPPRRQFIMEEAKSANVDI